MANEIDINFNSFDLDTNNNISIESINIQIAKSIREADLPKFHGSIIPIAKRKNITIRIKGDIIGTNYDDLRAKLDNLKNAIETSAEQKLTLDDDRFLNCQYRNFAYSYKQMRTFAEFSFDLVASDPFWYSNTLSNDTRTPTSGVSYNVTNNGNAVTRVKVTLTNNSGGSVADNIKLKNNTTGETFQYRGTLANTKALIVNNRVDNPDLLVTNDGVEDIKNFEGDFITLKPGVNQIVYTGTANVQVKLEFREANL